MDKFKTELPDTLNQVQRVLVVAPRIDDTTDTVVRYLADTYHLPINAVSFDVFGEVGNEVLVRHFVREQSAIPTPPTAKSARTRTMEELLDLASQNGVREIVDELRKLSDVLPSTTTYYLAFNLRARTLDKRYLAGISIYPTFETRAGEVELLVGYENLGTIFGVDPTAVNAFAGGLASVAKQVAYNFPGWSKLVLTGPAQAHEVCQRIRALVAAVPADPHLIGDISAGDSTV